MRSKIASDRARFRRYQAMAAVVSTGVVMSIGIRSSSLTGFPALRCRGPLRGSLLFPFQRGPQTRHQINDFRVLRRVIVADELGFLALQLGLDDPHEVLFVLVG